MDDLIRRQELENLLVVAQDQDFITLEEYEKFWNLVSRVPSAQPEIIRCKDCKYFAGEGMYCVQDIIVQYDHFYCYYAERREDE